MSTLHEMVPLGWEEVSLKREEQEERVLLEDLYRKSVPLMKQMKECSKSWDSPKKHYDDEEYLEAIETILEMNGVHLEPYGESFIRALPRKEVRKEGIPLIMDAEAKLGEKNRVVSMMIRRPRRSDSSRSRLRTTSTKSATWASIAASARCAS